MFPKLSLSFKFTKQNTVYMSCFLNAFRVGSDVNVNVYRQMPLLIMALNFSQNKPLLSRHVGNMVAAAHDTFFPPLYLTHNLFSFEHNPRSSTLNATLHADVGNLTSVCLLRKEKKKL
ncbi:hypothetical protein L798_08900 [Zootermopsis nevadensis]|uniref:Uncharacterized protein n=1 Tax=Zootermopsis nevadensis TaxID=136037 RepID=A0A067R3A4_ZOONE|nr:hypothetical protein L798_08900 [Zootermopsis nevadensis]